MENSVKILIISMRAGFGHLRAGDALLEYASNLKSVNAEHIDVAEFNPQLKLFMRFYEFVAKNAPFVWRLIYRFTDNFFVSMIIKIITATSPSFRRKAKEIIKTKNPDIILFTNIGPIAVILSACKKMLEGKKIGIIVTDYHGHYYYKFQKIDYYFVGHEQVKQDLESKGIDPLKIKVTGIPVNPGFYIKQSIADLKEKYKIKNNLPVVLLIGSFKTSEENLVNSIKTILSFNPLVNLIFIANGNNNYYKVAQDNFSESNRFLAVNWTNKMEEYMKISDIVISKAGGLTVSECLCLGKKMIITNLIPGQEDHNAVFLEKYGFGKNIKDISKISETLPEIILSVKKSVDKNSMAPRENPCQKIFTIILQNKI